MKSPVFTVFTLTSQEMSTGFFLCEKKNTCRTFMDIILLRKIDVKCTNILERKDNNPC